MLNEKKLCSLLKATYSRGYDIIPRFQSLTLNGHNWALICGAESVPKKAALQIVEHVGYMPTIPMSVQRACSNQVMFDGDAQHVMLELGNKGVDTYEMQSIPIVFKDRWQLYQTPQGGVFGFDTKILEVLQFEKGKISCCMSANNTIGIWNGAGHRLLIAPARFEPEDKQKLLHIATYDWANQRSNLTVVNMSLFQDDEDIEPDIIEE